jgi:acyl-CoA thioesterase I
VSERPKLSAEDDHGSRRLLKPIIFGLAFWAILAATWKASSSLNSNVVTLKEPQRIRLDNPGNLQKYRTANALLKPDPDRVVFLGDSITYLWDLGESFPQADFVNRGIGAQTTSDILERFRQDVIDLHPNTVVILAGINDFIWRNERSDSDALTLEAIKENDRTMAELADLHQIRPIFVSLLPVHNYTAAAHETYSKVPPGMIMKVNRWLQSFCGEHGYQYIDLYTSMVDEHGMLQRAYSDDGIHPNSAGYETMAKAFSAQYRVN